MMILLPPLRVSYRGVMILLLLFLQKQSLEDTWDEMSSGPQKLYLVQSITLYPLSIEDETLVHVAPELWPLRLLSSLTNKVDDRSEKLGSDILPSHVGL
jgi:hypothetical protein